MLDSERSMDEMKKKYTENAMTGGYRGRSLDYEK